MAASLAGTVFGFILSVMLARILGTAGYGTYSFAFSVAMTLAVMAKLGLPQPLIRDIASLESKSHAPGVRSLIKTADQRVLIAGASIIAVAALAVSVIDLPADRRTTLLWAIVLLPLVGLEATHSGALRGLGNVARGVVAMSVLRPGLLVAVIALVALAGGMVATPSATMRLHVLAAAASVAISGAWLLSRTSSSPSSTRRWHFGGTASFLGIEALQVLNVHIDILVLGFLMPPSELGVYRVAVSIGTLSFFFAAAANIVVQPEFARLYSRNDIATLQRLVTALTRLTSVATGLLVTLFALLGPLILRSFYGPDFLPAFVPLLVIAFGYLLSVLLGPVGTLLNMTTHEGESVRGLAFSVGMTVLVMLLLVPRIGVLGAALAHAVGAVVLKLYLVRRANRVLGVYPTIVGKRHVARS